MKLALIMNGAFRLALEKLTAESIAAEDAFAAHLLRRRVNELWEAASDAAAINSNGAPNLDRTQKQVVVRRFIEELAASKQDVDIPIHQFNLASSLCGQLRYLTESECALLREAGVIG